MVSFITLLYLLLTWSKNHTTHYLGKSPNLSPGAGGLGGAFFHLSTEGTLNFLTFFQAWKYLRGQLDKKKGLLQGRVKF